MRSRHITVALVLVALAVLEYAVVSHINIGKVLRAAAVSSLPPSASPTARPTPTVSATPSRGPTPAYDVTGLLRPAKKYLGVAIDGAPPDMSKISEFADRIGKRPNLVTIYQSFDDEFARSEARRVYAYGALPVIRWEPLTPTLASIAAGKQDAYVTRFARAVRAVNVPIVLTFAHEMNGDWYSWGRQRNTPAQFIAAWRHIHDVFERAGATNVIWTWTPNVINPAPGTRLKPYYPGDAYVDWVGIDGYYTNKGKAQRTFDTLFGPTLEEVRRFTGKPFLLVETAVEPGPTRPSRIADLFAGVAGSPDILGLVWFNNNGTGQWNIDRDPASVASFRARAKSAAFGFRVP